MVRDRNTKKKKEMKTSMRGKIGKRITRIEK